MAFEYCHLLVKIDPYNDEWIDNLKYFKNATLKEKTLIDDEDDSLTISLEDQDYLNKLRQRFKNVSLDNLDDGEENTISKYLCAHGHIFTHEETGPLKPACFVKEGTNVFGKFVTVNVERIFNDPGVIILRSIASDKDILHFKMEAYNELQTATVHNSETGKLETAKYRITQSSWLDKNHDSITRRMKARVVVATDLTLESAEMFQVANYGIGGFYDTHFDFSRMSDVALGGNTGFPRLGSSIKCSKV
ncbi:Prolyl 4-hydroxylase subunit alpha-1 [Thelohanellus kitauei]|uniref:Prolyl 4-hydroxylase subunit alpha-1 n=1 Tax=Thelohanellus kitauei TaxID=669202 RepID=A0A0C2MF34_THEKT|nr:Prolyl 4-hydroxylase subunit alpha-1 [Thelohanellus kitauei]